MYQVAVRAVVDGVPQGVFEVVHHGEAAACELRGLRPATAYQALLLLLLFIIKNTIVAWLLLIITRKTLSRHCCCFCCFCCH